jgi:hypothetical protein
VSWEASDYDEPDGTCEVCGLDLADDPDGDHDEHHTRCWSCWRGDQDVGPARTAASLAALAERLAALRSELDALRRRVEELEEDIAA